MAATDSGGFVAVWSSGFLFDAFGGNQDGDRSGVFAQRYGSGGAVIGGEFQVNSHTTNDQSHPSVAGDGAGGFVVVWSSAGQDGSGYGIFGRRYDSAGSAAGGEFQVNSFTSGRQWYPSVAMRPGGDFVVVWENMEPQDGSSYGVFGQRYDSAGMRIGSEFQVNSYTTSFQFTPVVAAHRQGGFVVVWTSTGQDGSSYGVFGRHYDANGVRVGAEFQINSYTTGSQLLPRLAMDDGGGFVVVWTSGTLFGTPGGDQDGDRAGVFGQRYDSAGVRRGAEFQVNTYTGGYQFFPSIASDGPGGFVVVWAGAGPGDAPYGIFGKRYDSSGNPIVGAFRVNTTTAGYQGHPALTRTELGRFVVAWDSDGQDGSSFGVFGQRLMEQPLDCECLITKIQTPGGGLVANLRNTSPGLLGNGSQNTRFVRILTRLVGTTCPMSVQTTLTPGGMDPDGDPIDIVPVSAAITCSLGSTTRTDFDATYRPENCPGGTGPAPGQDSELGEVVIFGETANTPSTRAGFEQSSKSIRCKASPAP